MMPHTAQALGQARLAGLHHHAQRGALASAARQAAARDGSSPGPRARGTRAAVTTWAGRPGPARGPVMAAGRRPGPAATARRDAAARPSGTGARRVALFASGLQPSDAPTAEVAAEAITATVRRFGSQGCAGRVAQEFGDHPDTAGDAA